MILESYYYLPLAAGVRMQIEVPWFVAGLPRGSFCEVFFENVMKLSRCEF
jgi:hypothetical protein